MTRRYKILLIGFLVVLAAGLAAARLQASGLTDDAIAIDYTCRQDSDCAIKDVGNCCGYYPQCVNAAAKTDPARVAALCAKEGQAGVCGFPSITGCRCVEGRCAGYYEPEKSPAPDPSTEAPSPDEDPR